GSPQKITPRRPAGQGLRIKECSMATLPTDVDRFRIGAPSSSGMRLVTDRRRSESFWVYQQMTLRQQLSGHEPGRWYFQAVGVESAAPVSLDYESFESALR